MSTLQNTLKYPEILKGMLAGGMTYGGYVGLNRIWDKIVETLSFPSSEEEEIEIDVDGTPVKKKKAEEYVWQDMIKNAAFGDQISYGLGIFPGVYLMHQLIKSLGQIGNDREYNEELRKKEKEIENKYSKKKQEKKASYQKEDLFFAYQQGFNDRINKESQDNPSNQFLKQAFEKDAASILDIIKKIIPRAKNKIPKNINLDDIDPLLASKKQQMSEKGLLSWLTDDKAVENYWKAKEYILGKGIVKPTITIGTVGGLGYGGKKIYNALQASEGVKKFVEAAKDSAGQVVDIGSDVAGLGFETIKKWPELMGLLVPMGYLAGKHLGEAYYPYEEEPDYTGRNLVFKKKEKEKKASFEKDSFDVALATQLIGSGYLLNLIRRSMGLKYAKMFQKNYIDKNFPDLVPEDDDLFSMPEEDKNKKKKKLQEEILKTSADKTPDIGKYYENQRNIKLNNPDPRDVDQNVDSWQRTLDADKRNTSTDELYRAKQRSNILKNTAITLGAVSTAPVSIPAYFGYKGISGIWNAGKKLLFPQHEYIDYSKNAVRVPQKQQTQNLNQEKQIDIFGDNNVQNPQIQQQGITQGQNQSQYPPWLFGLLLAGALYGGYKMLR